MGGKCSEALIAVAEGATDRNDVAALLCYLTAPNSLAAVASFLAAEMVLQASFNLGGACVPQR